MDTKLTKVFEQKNGNTIEVNCRYEEWTEDVDVTEVICYNYKKRVFTDLTELFDTLPELQKLVNNINWRENYAEYMAAKEEEVEND
jgi:hypothetical protein